MIVVRVTRPSTRTCLGILVAGVLSAGCTPTKKPLLPQPPATQQSDRWGTQATIHRIHNLSKEADNLAADVAQLPGRDDADHSRIMQRIFTDLVQTLTLMGDPTNDRQLNEKILTIQTARATLANASGELRIEPTIDSALQSADAALADLSHSDAFQEADLGSDLDKLSASTNHLSDERDAALHRVDVERTMDLMSAVVSKMAASLSARLTVEQSPTPAPASAPSGTPAATEPAAAPAPTTQSSATPATKP